MACPAICGCGKTVGDLYIHDTGVSSQNKTFALLTTLILNFDFTLLLVIFVLLCGL
jgi:hypothetical protein